MKKTVKFKSDTKGSPDGFTVKDYKQGEVHELPSGLADAFIGDDIAVEIRVAGDGENEPKRQTKEINPVKEKKAKA